MMRGAIDQKVNRHRLRRRRILRDIGSLDTMRKTRRQ